MVVDQGGRDGVLVPFFGRQASMSVGAIRMGLKLNVPLCFSVIIRQNGAQHRVVIHKALELVNTGNLEQDIVTNLNKITKLMEHYISEYPEEYMWFYKIWKYSKETTVVVLSDKKTGHLRQSEFVAKDIQKALSERQIESKIKIIEIVYKNTFSEKACSLMSAMLPSFLYQGRLHFLKNFLTDESFSKIMAVKADFFISCGSSIAGINKFLSKDHNAKSVIVLKPGLLKYNSFDLLVLPQHDFSNKGKIPDNAVIYKIAPNSITKKYLNEQTELLFERYSHLRNNVRFKIGIFIGGHTKKLFLSEQQIKIMIHQVKEIAQELNADILVTTSRRTTRSN